MTFTDLVFIIAQKWRNFLNRHYSRMLRSKLFGAGKNLYIQYPTYFFGIEGIEIGDNFRCDVHNRLNTYGPAGTARLRIGNNVSMEGFNHIGASNLVEIGDGTMLASRIFITDHFHGHITTDELDTPVAKRPVVSKGPVIIGRNVWIGEGVAIMPGVTIGDGAIIGANAVVTHDVPPRCIAAGNPARIIRKLN